MLITVSIIWIALIYIACPFLVHFHVKTQSSFMYNCTSKFKLPRHVATRWMNNNASFNDFFFNPD